jgi:hypothetical protein
MGERDEGMEVAERTKGGDQNFALCQQSNPVLFPCAKAQKRAPEGD